LVAQPTTFFYCGNVIDTSVDAVFPRHLFVSSLAILKRCGMLRPFTVSLKAGRNNMARFMEFIKELFPPLLLAILIFFKKCSSNNFSLFMDEGMFSQVTEFVTSFLHRVHNGVGIVT
jgi:hypothetical protein